jgi:hypothetical protein
MHEALVEDTASGMWCFVVGRVFLDVSNDFSALIFRVQQPKEELQAQRHNAACQKNSISAVSATDLTKHLVLFAVNILLLPLALQPSVGFGLSNNTLPFFFIYHQLSPSSHSQHLKISFYLFSPSFPGSSSLSHPFHFLSEDLFGHPILLHSLQVTQPTYPLPLYPFYYIFSFTQPF